MITKIKTKSHEEWLEERKKSLGGSDIGAVLGMNEYSSPYKVWADKTGKLPPFEGNEWTRLGNDLEDYVAKRFTEVSGLKVVNDTATWRNSKYPHLHANFDRRVVGMKAGVECKLTSELNAKKYKDGEFPDRFYSQCVAYLCVSEYERWFLAVLIYGKGIKIYQMTRIPNDTKPEWCEASVYVDDAEIEALAKATEAFWNDYVLTDTPPIPDGSKATTEAISTIYAESDGSAVSLMGCEQDLKQYMTLSSLLDDVKKQRDEVANRIKVYMGEASKGETRNFKVTYSSYTKNTFDIKAFAKEHASLNLSPYYLSSVVRPFKVNEIK
ncbi:MAG: YqaJ viral recombinase family protein [Clostridia bacterium]|nr:YqaJ viral recombinase family protein [Clostridia bacterium]